jgi:hypothetical protein
MKIFAFLKRLLKGQGKPKQNTSLQIDSLWPEDRRKEINPFLDPEHRNYSVGPVPMSVYQSQLMRHLQK